LTRYNVVGGPLGRYLDEDERIKTMKGQSFLKDVKKMREDSILAFAHQRDKINLSEETSNLSPEILWQDYQVNPNKYLSGYK
jgi:hypothetical protein